MEESVVMVTIPLSDAQIVLALAEDQLWAEYGPKIEEANPLQANAIKELKAAITAALAPVPHGL